MFEASGLEAARGMSITYSNFTHNIFATDRRRVPVFGGKPKVKEHLEDLGVDGRILKWILKSGVGAWTGLVWLRLWKGSRLL
jgi:hypothetical protein